MFNLSFMKLQTFICLVLFSTVLQTELRAQTIEFIEPRHVQSVAQAEFSTFIVNDHLYVLQKQYRTGSPVSFDLQLDVYDPRRKPLASHVIDKTLEMGDANIYEGIFALKDQLVMFKSEFSKASGSKVSNIYYYPFEINGRRKKKVLLGTYPAESAFNSPNFVVAASPNGGKFAVITELPYEKDGMEKCIVTVYDNTFKELWKKEYAFPYESTKAPKNELFLNNDGIAFILKRIKIKKQFDKFSIFTFYGNGQTVVEKKIDLGNAFTISTYKNIYNDAGDLVLAGYYYTDKNVGINVETPDGPFYIRANATNGDLAAAKANTVKPQKQNLVALQVIPMGEQGVIVLGEQRFVTSMAIQGKPFEYNYEYITKDISLSRLGDDGSLIWDYQVEKELKSANDGGRFLSSYALLAGDDVRLLFSDFLYKYDNKKQAVIGPGLSGQRVGVIQTIGADGKLKSGSYVADPRIGGKTGEYMFIPVTATKFGTSLFLLSARGAELVGTRLTY